MERWFLQGEFRPLFHETPLFRTIGEIGWTSGGPGGVQTTVEFGCTTRTAIPTLSPNKHLAILNKLFAVKSDCQVVLVEQTKKGNTKKQETATTRKNKERIKRTEFHLFFPIPCNLRLLLTKSKIVYSFFLLTLMKLFHVTILQYQNFMMSW